MARHLATLAKLDTDDAIAELRRELKEAQRTICSLQAKQARLPDTLEEVLQAVQRGAFSFNGRTTAVSAMNLVSVIQASC